LVIFVLTSLNNLDGIPSSIVAQKCVTRLIFYFHCSSCKVLYAVHFYDDAESEGWVPMCVCECVTLSSVALSKKSTLWQAPCPEGIWCSGGISAHFNLTV